MIRAKALLLALFLPGALWAQTRLNPTNYPDPTANTCEFLTWNGTDAKGLGFIGANLCVDAPDAKVFFSDHGDCNDTGSALQFDLPTHTYSCRDLATSTYTLSNKTINSSANTITLGSGGTLALESVTLTAILDNEVLVGSGAGAGSFVALQDCVDGTESLDFNGTAFVCNTITGGSASNSFETMNAPAGTDPVADSSTDTLNLTVVGPLTLTGNSTTDTLAFGWSGTFADAQIAASNVTQHQAALTITESQISDLAHLSQEQVEDFAGALVANPTGTHTGVAITYQDATGDMDFVVDHDAATNFLAAEHVDWASASAGTIHATNYVDDDQPDDDSEVPDTLTHSGGSIALESLTLTAILDNEVLVGTGVGTGSFVALQDCVDGTESLDFNGTAFVCNTITGGSASNSFETMNAPAGTDPVADSSTDTLNLTVVGPLTLTGNATTDTLAFDWSGTFADAQIAQSNVTQHEAALSITASQISDQHGGTNITTDMEEETHVTEHAENGADELLGESMGTACTDGQILKANATGGLDCGTDNTGGGGTPNILDLGDDGTNESTDLVEIATTGDTNSIFTEPSADKLLIAVGNNWPTADAAVALSANGANCAAGQWAAGVDASGAAEGCTVDDDQPDDDSEVPDAITVAGGTINTSSITLVQSAAPTPTAEGRIEWETDDDHIIVGDGVGQVEFVPAEDVSGDATMTDDGVVTVAATHSGSAHHAAVTVSGTPDYITLSGQDIVRGSVDLAADVTGTLPVGNGGTGATTLTDGGILLGSGTGAITALGVATNGQIPIGDGTTDPVLATISGTANEIEITNGAGSIQVGIVTSPTLDGTNFTGIPGAAVDNGTIPAARVGTDHIDSADEVAAGVIGSSELTDNDILEVDLKVVNAPTDEYCFTYEATGGDFEWQPCGSGSPGGSDAQIQYNDGGAFGGIAPFTFDDVNEDMTFAPTLDIATGNEVGLSVNPTCNKATSGDCTAVQINVTDTASPGALKPFEAQVGGSQRFSINEDGRVTINDGTNSTCLDLSGDRVYHDTDCDSTKDAGEEFIDQAGGGGGKSTLMTVTTFISNASDTRFWGWDGGHSSSCNQNIRSTIIATGGTIQNLYCFASTTPASGQTCALTLFDDCVATSVACSVTDSSGNECSNTSDTRTISAGDVITFRAVSQTNACGNVSCSFEIAH